MQYNNTVADNLSVENTAAPKIFVEVSSKSQSFQKPILWVADTAIALQLSPAFDVFHFGDISGIAPGEHYLIVERGTPEEAIRAIGWRLSMIGVQCKVYQVQTSLESLLCHDAMSLQQVVLQIFEFALPFEHWTALKDEQQLSTREAVNIATIAMAILPEPQKSVELATLRKRCHESSYDWNRLMGTLEQEFRVEVQKRTAEAGKRDGTQASKSRTIPPADIIAQRIAEDYRSILAYNNEIAQWMRYEAEHPGIWTPETNEFIESIVYQNLTVRGIEGYNSHSYITNIVKSLRNQLIRRFWYEPSPTEFLPHRNGVLEIATGKLLPHSPDYGFTWSLPRDYNPLFTDWSTIDSFLDHVSGNNPQIKDLLLCYCNAVLKGRHDLQKFLHLIGVGGTGKGTFARLIVGLIGKENVHTTTLEDWCTNRFEGANAYGKRLVLFPDEDKQTGKLGKFLSLTGEDLIRAEEKNKKAFQYRYDGMVLVLSNLPVFTGDSASRVKRRIITVPCNNQVSLLQRSSNIEQKFEIELAAFTNYILSIPDDHVTNVMLGLVEIPECTLEFWENRIRTDSIAAWLNDWVIYDPMAETAIGSNSYEESSGEPITLYGSYAQHCRRSGNQVKAVKNFSPDLLELCRSVLGWDVEKKVTKTGKFIRGLRLRTDKDREIPTHDYSLMERVTDMMTTGDGCGDESQPLLNKDFTNGDELNLILEENLVHELDTSVTLSDNGDIDSAGEVSNDISLETTGLGFEPKPLPDKSSESSPQSSPDSTSVWMNEENLQAMADDLEACDDIEMLQIIREIYNKEALKVASRRISLGKREQIKRWIAQLDAEYQSLVVPPG
jgi:P4 family phage/plasmid primase-like protien